MTIVFNPKTLFAASVCTFVLAMPSAAQEASVLGVWDVTVSSNQGPTSAPLVLKQEGETIVGTFSGPQGDQAVEASLTDKAITIWFSVRTQNGPISITMNGAVNGDTMKGTMDFGGRGHGDWLAKRPAAAPAAVQAGVPRLDLSGSWAFQVEFSGGSGTPTITLKQDGDKLSGRYSGQLGEAPLTGTVKGNAVEFAIDVTVEGNAVHIVYAGTAEKDSMKGTVKIDDFGEGTFTAQKKT